MVLNRLYEGLIWTRGGFTQSGKGVKREMARREAAGAEKNALYFRVL